MSLRAVSLFSNCGAGDVGYARAGFDFAVMAEKELRRLGVAINNHPSAVGVPGDVRTTWRAVVDLYGQLTERAFLDLLAACPPCQGMSSARSGLGLASNPADGSRDERNLLADIIADVVEALTPRAVIVENVPQFLTRLVLDPRDGKGMTAVTAARLLTDRLQEHYAVYPVLLDLADYGVPQTRRRTFLTFLRRDLPCVTALKELNSTPFPMPTHVSTAITFAEAVGHLPELDPATRPQAEYPLHVVPRWSTDDWRYRMIAATAPEGGSAWDNVLCEAGHLNDIPGINQAMCVAPGCGGRLLRPVVAGESGPRLVNGFRNTSYRRMKANAPAATITTASGHVGSDTTLHPTQPRLLSVLECAKLQTFPEDFDWGDTPTKWGLGQVRAMIGEAVPPHFTQQHGEVLAALLRGEVPANLLPASDRRHARARRRLFARVPDARQTTLPFEPAA